jgi:hypothetical protein
VAKEHLFSMRERRRHARHPIEVLALELQEIAPTEFNENSILIAPHRRKAALNQQVRGSGGLERAADMIAKVHDLVDAEGSYVRKHRFKCRAIPVYIRNCSKFHLALPLGWPMM